jgi:hypothetical protein
MTDRTPLARVVRLAGGPDIPDRLGTLPGADLTTLLLRVMRLRTARLKPSDVFRRYTEDRFTAPAEVPFDLLRRTEDRLISLLPQGFQSITLAPVVPLGTHSVVGPVNQDKVLATIRGTEVAADPTNGLALAAARLRSGMLAVDRRSAEDMRLATVQRVVRAQMFDGPGMFAHFGLLGMVPAGRDTGDLAFERRHAVEHLRYLATALPGRVELRTTAWEPRYAVVADAVRAALPDVAVVDQPDREAGRHYYTGFAWGADIVDGDDRVNVADGGFVDWTQRLLGNQKERLCTSGIGIERLAVMGAP